MTKKGGARKRVGCRPKASVNSLAGNGKFPREGIAEYIVGVEEARAELAFVSRGVKISG
jgi:hypothetical protein